MQERKHRDFFKLVTAAVMAVILGAVPVWAQTVTWNGDDTGGDLFREQPDTNSWSGATYNAGTNVQFLGAGLGTVTVGAGGVPPGNILVDASGDYAFAGDGKLYVGVEIPPSGTVVMVRVMRQKRGCIQSSVV